MIARNPASGSWQKATCSWLNGSGVVDGGAGWGREDMGGGSASGEAAAGMTALHPNRGFWADLGKTARTTGPSEVPSRSVEPRGGQGGRPAHGGSTITRE